MEIKLSSSWEPRKGIEDVADSISSVVRETGFNAGNQLPQICVYCANNSGFVGQHVLTFVLRLCLALQVKKSRFEADNHVIEK